MAIRTKFQIPAWPQGLESSDVDLLSRIKRREPEALGELYDRCGKLAYSIILRIVPDEDVAEDLLAETFVTVWNQIARWKDARFEDLRLWLLLLARHHALEYLRSHNEPLPKALPRQATLTKPSILQDFPRPKNNEERHRLQTAFSTLTEKEARILEMACFDGMSIGEISVMLGEPVAAVRESVSEALRKLSGEAATDP
jgi:RNA polymerase sigma-70 factor (ECF subfamily)